MTNEQYNKMLNRIKDRYPKTKCTFNPYDKGQSNYNIIGNELHVFLYDKPCHYRKLGFKFGNFINTEYVTKQSDIEEYIATRDEYHEAIKDVLLARSIKHMIENGVSDE